MEKYTIRDFNDQFKSDEDCLRFIWDQRFPGGVTCSKCRSFNSFYPVKKRRCYSCKCGFQIYPTEGTIFHKSPTSLRTWFFAMFLIGASKNGVSAKELQRQIGVTYKCAWRMNHQIRLLLKENGIVLQGIVEADETFVGGHRKDGQDKKDKTIVLGMVERGGKVVAKIVPDLTTDTLLPEIVQHVMPQTLLITDEWKSYRKLRHRDFKHERVHHRAKEFVRGNIHTNSIEGFWSQLKRSINGTFHSVSRKHLQKYVNELLIATIAGSRRYRCFFT